MEGSPYSSYTPLPTQEAPQKAPSHKRLWMTLIILGIIGIGLSFFINRVPGDTAATVNGEIITESEVDKRSDQIVAAYSAQGTVVEDADLLAEIHTQALQTAITDALLLQEAQRIGITVATTEVDERLGEFEGTEDDLNKALTTYGISPDELRKQIGMQLAIEKLVANYTKLHGVSASEGEMQDLYKQIVKTESATSSYEDLYTDLRLRVLKQKTDKLMIEYVNALRDKAKIRIYDN